MSLAEEAEHLQVCIRLAQCNAGLAVRTGNFLAEIAHREFDVTAASGAGHFQGRVCPVAAFQHPVPCEACCASKKQVPKCYVGQHGDRSRRNAEGPGETVQEDSHAVIPFKNQGNAAYQVING